MSIHVTAHALYTSILAHHSGLSELEVPNVFQNADIFGLVRSQEPALQPSRAERVRDLLIGNLRVLDLPDPAEALAGTTSKGRALVERVILKYLFLDKVVTVLRSNREVVEPQVLEPPVVVVEGSLTDLVTLSREAGSTMAGYSKLVSNRLPAWRLTIEKKTASLIERLSAQVEEVPMDVEGTDAIKDGVRVFLRQFEREYQRASGYEELQHMAWLVMFCGELVVVRLTPTACVSLTDFWLSLTPP